MRFILIQILFLFNLISLISDSIYTERYMGLPNINELGYEAGRLSTRAKQLKGKKFLLVHGTLDDNVHYQQAMILAKNLERHDILFKQIVSKKFEKI